MAADPKRWISQRNGAAVALIGSELGAIQQTVRDYALHHLQHRRDLLGLRGSCLTLASTIGTRQASYALNSPDWTVVRTFDGEGASTSRLHAGDLDLAASTPRRPDATLTVSTDGDIDRTWTLTRGDSED